MDLPLPLLWLSLAFLAGILAGESLGWPMPVWLWLGGAVLAVAVVSRRVLIRKRRPRGLLSLPSLPLPVWVLFLAMLAGGARFRAAQPEMSPGFIGWYSDTRQRLTIVGVVVDPPDVRDTYVNLRVQVERLRPADTVLHNAVDGLLLARLPPGDPWRYGDRVVLTGELETPPEDDQFSYREYLARQGVYAYLPKGRAALLEPGQGSPVLEAIFALRGRSLATVYRLFPDPEASLLAGILLGVESGIPRHVQEAFKATGTSHIIAISGFNITILAGLFASGFGRLLGVRWGAVASVLGISAYTLLVGADAAVVRAAIMGAMGIFARQVGRQQAGLNSLAITAAVMALFDPQVLWDVGFQLSFAATLGLVLYAEPLAAWFIQAASRHIPEARAERLAGPVGEYLLFTLAAQLTTLPVTIYHFRRLSLSALVANPAILPVQPLVMILSGLAVIAGLVYVPAGRVLAGLAWPFVAYTIRVVEAFAELRGGVLVLGQAGLLVVVGFYGLLLGWTFAGERLRACFGSWSPAAPLAGLAAVTVLTWRAALQAPDGRLHLVVLDVGSGEAILLHTPTGRNLLIGGGPRATLLSDALGRRLPMGGRELDWLVVAAPFEEQVGALVGTLERFPPRRVLWAGARGVSRSARLLNEALTEANIPVNDSEVGQRLELGAGATLEVLAEGHRGAVLLLVWERFRALLPVGLDFETLDGLEHGEAIGQVSVLMLAEGGYAPLNPPAWIGALRPRLAVLSVAADDYAGLPSEETLDALAGYSLLRTDRNGWVEISTDGARMWVVVEKGG